MPDVNSVLKYKILSYLEKLDSFLSRMPLIRVRLFPETIHYSGYTLHTLMYPILTGS